jgi:methylated-DNA-protein-cysteine methyltransferase related protein
LRILYKLDDFGAGESGASMSSYTSPPDLHIFQARVWEMVRQIPRGKVATYGQIASLITLPPGMDPRAYLAFGPRWVGGAMAACPEDVPWQRVINARGMISPRPGAEDQRALLEQEGINFDEGGRVNLFRDRWSGPYRKDRDLTTTLPLK